MTRGKRKDIAVVIPARCEANRIAACLRAISGQSPQRVRIVLVVNNTTDATEEIARAVATANRLDLEVLVRNIAPDQGAGAARRIGCAHALRTMSNLRYLMSTDADCIVSSDWVSRNLAHLEIVDAVCGKVELLPGEAGILDRMDRRLAAYEGTYRELVQNIYARCAAGCADIRGTHGEAAGASLSFSKAAYVAVGGFEPVGCGEDRRLVRAFRRAGFRVRHAEDVTVRASCRLTGRAVGGMSDALKARVEGGDYLVDDCLPPAQRIMEQASRKSLGPWPPCVPHSRRLNVHDLPENIETLKKFGNSRQPGATSIAPTEPAPLSRSGAVWPEKGSATDYAGRKLLAHSDLKRRLAANQDRNIGDPDRERNMR